MSLDNPYRAAGAFSGKAYIRRDADAQLLEQIEDNQYYPYFAAPRQSGKSSLLLRTMTALDPAKYRVALVDLSPFVVGSFDDFWRQFLSEIARAADFDPAPIGEEDPRDVLLMWLRGCEQRLIVFMDEIDVLLSVDCREQIFSKLRTFFNLRARPDTAALGQVQFVLAGAAHSSRFIKDPRWSPFNVAIEIELEDLSSAQVSQLAVYLASAGAFAGSDLTARVHELTGGSVFLCQLVFEQLWSLAARGKPRLSAGDVDDVVAAIVAESPRNIHFYNIFRLVTADARLTMLFRRLSEGQELGQEEHKELRLTGICRGASPFRNEVYARVFGPGGPLDLKVNDRQLQLTRALDAAIVWRDQLLADPQAEPRALERAEAEIRKVRRSFREGAQLQAGDVLGHGRFRLDELIGQGGFAAVWRATDLRDASTVAIKILHGQFAEDKSRRERFFRGAWKMSELQHPAIVRVLEPYGDDNGRYFFVMEHLAGGTLHDVVQAQALAGNPLEPIKLIKLIMQVGDALHFAHVRGLVHRDVKPSNVMIAGERAKLTDFDLVRDTDLTGGTRTGAMGTFLYAAPEVMSRPQEADPRADIYGLGMTAVFALFGGDLAMDVIRNADAFIDHLPCNPVIHDVLKKAVAWDRHDRFASAAEFVSALERACELPVAASGSALWSPASAAAPSRTGAPPPVSASRSKAGAPARPGLSPAALRALQALETLDEDEDEDEFELQVADSGEHRALRDVEASGGEATPLHPGLTAAAVTAAALRAGSGPMLGRSPTWPKDHGPAAPSGPTPATRATPARQRTYLVGLAAALLLLLVGRGVLDRFDATVSAPKDAPRFAEAAVPGATTRSSQDETGPAEVHRVEPVASTSTSTSTSSALAESVGPPVADDGTEEDGSSGAVLPVEGPKAPRVAELIAEGCRQVRIGDARRGVEALLAAHDRAPRDLQLRWCIADGYAKLGKYESALRFYGDLLVEFPGHPRALLGAAQANEYLKRRGAAEALYKRLLESKPNDASAKAFFAAQQAAP